MMLLRILLFIVNPFISAIDSLINISRKNTSALLYCWFLVFGMCFCAVNQEADSYRYYLGFLRDSNLSSQAYLSQVASYFTFHSEIKDIYTLSVNFFVSRFSSNYHWVFLIYAAVFGFFYIKSIRVFLKFKVTNRATFYVLLFLICISNPIFNINGVRFWTAAWITVYSFLRIAIDKNYWYSLLLLITPLIHASYIIVFIFALLYITSRYFVKLWIVLFVLSTAFTAMSYLDVLGDVQSFLPDSIQYMISSYTEDVEKLEILEGVGEPLYARVLKALPRVFIIVLTIIYLLRRKSSSKDNTEERLLAIYLIIASFSNFTISIPSTGIRFIQLSFPLFAVLWAKSHNRMKVYDPVIVIGIPICFAYSLVPWFRNVISVTELPLYFYPLPLQIIHYLVLP